jgi:hypothetical protein
MNTARPPFGQKIVPIFWPAGKTEVFSGKFALVADNPILGRETTNFCFSRRPQGKFSQENFKIMVFIYRCFNS